MRKWLKFAILLQEKRKRERGGRQRQHRRRLNKKLKEKVINITMAHFDVFWFWVIVLAKFILEYAEGGPWFWCGKKNAQQRNPSQEKAETWEVTWSWLFELLNNNPHLWREEMKCLPIGMNVKIWHNRWDYWCLKKYANWIDIFTFLGLLEDVFVNCKYSFVSAMQFLEFCGMFFLQMKVYFSCSRTVQRTVNFGFWMHFLS